MLQIVIKKQHHDENGRIDPIFSFTMILGNRSNDLDQTKNMVPQEVPDMPAFLFGRLSLPERVI